MAEDREILREIWDGKLPICFQLSSDEVLTMQQPEPYYLMVPRQSFFPLVTDKVKKHFIRHSEVTDNSELWLEYNGQPLKWHYPIGVLYDLLMVDMLPWNLTVHFKNFPEETLVHCPSRSAVESHFMAMVKESDTIKHRGQVINNMQRKDHNQLWLGLQNDKFDQFWAINRKLMEHTSDEPFKSIPFRIYEPDKLFIQRLFKPVSDNDKMYTLADLLEHAVDDFSSKADIKNSKIVIQGVEPPLETPIQWLSEHFSHPDNFLHICILPL